MKVKALKNLLAGLDDELEVKVSVEEYKENQIRAGTIVAGNSQILGGLSIKRNVLCLQGIRNADLKGREAGKNR